MKRCIHVPRILLPRGDERAWAVIACDQFTSDRAYWERVAQEVGDKPSTLRFILPEAYLGDGDEEERIAELHENMHESMVNGDTYKLDRGFVLTERTTQSGTRRGILACLDLEDYTYEKGVVSPIRSSEEVVADRLPPRVALRRGAPLEFPHALVFYKDKKDKIMRALLREGLEKLYDFDLMEDGGHLTGYFIPEYIAEDVANELQGKEEPSFAIADGNHSVAAAKAFWEEVKATLSERERRTHPARFCLVELVNVYDSAIIFHPIHRLVKGVEEEAFCDFFCREVACKREGKVLVPRLAGGANAVSTVDTLVEKFVKINGGSIDYIHGDHELAAFSEEEGCVGIALGALKKDDFFAQLKGGKNFPKKTFSIGEGREKRYYLEGREISYD